MIGPVIVSQVQAVRAPVTLANRPITIGSWRILCRNCWKCFIVLQLQNLGRHQSLHLRLKFWVRLSLRLQWRAYVPLRPRCAESKETQIKLSLVKISFDFDDWISASCCSEWKSLIGWHNLSWKNWKIINDTEHFIWITTEFNRQAWFQWIFNDDITIYES